MIRVCNVPCCDRLQASESFSLHQAKSRLLKTNWHVTAVIKRLAPLLPSRPLQILEVGASQGRGLIALARLGHDAYGVEPWKPAIDIAYQLAADEGVKITIVEASAERIPFDGSKFDLVLAFSVMEHVTDLNASLGEILRVLKPGGVFWFSSASSLCPIQNEVRGFPLFGWYPMFSKKYIMKWSLKFRPHLIGYTTTPAMHWWTPYNARKRLRKAGFKQIMDRWILKRDEEAYGVRGMFLNLAKAHPILRLIGDVLSPGCSYAARKPLS